MLLNLTKMGLICLLIYFIFPSYIFAQAPFHTSLKSEYIISDSSETVVNHHIILENTTSSTYASEYAFEISSVDIKDLVIKDKEQNNLKFYTSVSDTTTTLNLEFTDPIVGKGRSREFTISYKQADLGQVYGKVLEVSIPKIIQIDSIDDFEISLLIHNNFPKEADIDPTPNRLSQTDQYTIYHFNDKTNLKNGIHAIFGDKQVFSFALNYHLENPTVNNGLTQITLPPDTAFQKVYYEFLDPKPEKIVTDGDGNWIATYILKPKEQIGVIAKGYVEIYLEPTVPVPQFTKNINNYLDEKLYWEVNDSKIKELADQLKTPQAIYTYLVDHFSYNYNRLDVSTGRLGAVEAISNPDQVICQEFTDAFIAIARAAGIPAREHNGFAFTQNQRVRPLSLVKDVLHSWPEYFDVEKQTWIQVDPTWGNTTGGMDYFNKLDLNHFTFVVHGLDSVSPYPVGYFKAGNTYDKDILVEFSQESPQEKGELEVSIKPNFLHLFGLPLQTNLNIKNNTNRAFYKKDVIIDSDVWSINWAKNSVESVLPFTQTNLPLFLKAPGIFNTNPEKIEIEIEEKIYELEIKYNQKDYIYLGIFLISVAGLCLIFTLTARSILVYRRKR